MWLNWAKQHATNEVKGVAPTGNKLTIHSTEDECLNTESQFTSIGIGGI